MSKRKGNRKIFIICALVLVVLAVLTFWVTRHKQEPDIAVTTEKVARRNLTESVVANGRIYPVLQVHISAEVSGEITEMHVKEGDFVHKGDLLLKIRPDLYVAALNQAKASYQSSLAARTTAAANLEKAEADYNRNVDLYHKRLISEADFIGFKVGREVSMASLQSASNQVDMAMASVASADEALSKTTILAPIDGTVSKLNSQVGERVLGTVQNAGTDIMVISDLSRMEARVDIGEMDIVLLKPGQNAKLEVDSFKDRKFAGIVTDVANSSKDMNSSASAFSSSSSSSGQTATQFQVRIRFQDLEDFRPGMSVGATIETRTRSNVITAPITAVTTRIVKGKAGNATNSIAAASTNPPADISATNVPGKADKKSEPGNKPVEVVFVLDGEKVKAMPVKIGIADENYWEITEGLKEGDEIVTGGFKAISRDLDDGKSVKKNHGPIEKL
ncbi:MAG TPA: efflux RND transporter periplasmic adaptor subunit [Verrucomicrobiae bacterium]